MNFVGTALVTGAGVRVGRAIASSLGARGYRVAVHYRNSAESAEEVVGKIRCERKNIGAASAFRADLADRREVGELVMRVSKWAGEAVSLLVNNASVFERDEWDSVTPDRWDRHLAVNLEAPYILSRCVGEGLCKGLGLGNGLVGAKAGAKVGRGVIVNMIDQRVLNLTPHFVSYSVSKYGLLGLTRMLALALAPQVRVVGIGLGQVLASAQQSEAEFIGKAEATPMGEAVSLEDVCRTLNYILDSKSVTGQMLALDGGEHLGWRQASPDANGIT